jgi:hypothetical protein
MLQAISYRPAQNAVIERNEAYESFSAAGDGNSSKVS